MALRQTVELEIEGHEDPIVVAYTAVDLRAWEREFDKSCLAESMSLSMLTWLGWHAAKRTGALNGMSGSTWRDFDAVCVGVKSKRDEDTDAARPTGPTQSGDS